MRDRFSVIGFTEAELGFVAAILLFAALVSHRSHAAIAHPTLAKRATPTASATPVSSPTPAVSLRDYNDLEKKYHGAQQSYAQEVAKNQSLQQSYVREAAKNQSLQQAYAAEVRNTRALQAQSRHETDLRSRLTPTCKEKHIASGALADIEVRGSDEFGLGDKTYHLEGLLQHFAVQLQQAKSGGCRQVIGVIPGTGISTRDFVTGTVRLGTYFYTPLVKPRPIAEAPHGEDAE